MEALAGNHQSSRPSAYVQQRPGEYDCVVAVCSTVTGLPYDTLADAFGFNGSRGVSMLEVVAPLLSFGFISCFLVLRDAGPAVEGQKLLTLPELKSWLEGRSAILCMSEAIGEHALAWRDGQLIDCRSGRDDLSLDGLPVKAALLIHPMRTN